MTEKLELKVQESSFLLPQMVMLTLVQNTSWIILNMPTIRRKKPAKFCEKSTGY